MSSWLIIVILIIFLIIIFGLLILLYWDIKKMTKQLENIIQNFGTNELIRSNSQSKILTKFVMNINQLIQFFKREQQKMLKREKEIKQEITNISHDLRTPLTSIQGFTELLTDPNLTEEEKLEYIYIIQKKIDHLLMITDAFYEFSQIDSADKQLHLVQLELDQIVIETMLLYHEEFEKRNLTVYVGEGEIPPFIADRKASTRIVTNIIQNALRYAKSYFKIYFFEEEHYVYFRAINDVEQFNRQELNRIFDRTFRLDTSRASGHLGLGLHIVKRLIEIQAGKVTANIENDEFIIDVKFKKMR